MLSLSSGRKGVNVPRLFLIAAVCLLAACTQQAVRTSDFIIGIESGPQTLDPRLAVDAYSSKLSKLVHAGLFRIDEKLQLQPYLLEAFKQLSADEYKFQLRNGVQFHNGTPLTAHDVAWTYNSIRKRQVPSPHYASFSKIKELKVLDDYNFVIKLEEPFAPFLSSLTLGILAKPKDGAKSDPLNGAGPYRVVAYALDEKVQLEAFNKFFDGTPTAKQLLFKVIRDDNLRVLELVRGRLDLLQNNVPAALLPYVQNHKDLAVDAAPGINYSYLGFNLEEPELSHLKVRQAIAYALDIPEIIKYKLKGYARPASGILAPMHWAYHGASPSYDYDPQKSKALLDEAGYPDPDGAGPKGRFRLLYKTSSKRDRIGMARLIAQYLYQVGIDVVVTPYEWGTLFRDIRSGNFQLYSLTWVGVTEPDIYYYAFNSSQMPPVGANRNRYRNGSIDRLTEAGRKEGDLEMRKRIYYNVQDIIAQELPYINLWYEDNVVVRLRDVKGYTIYPNASFMGLANLYRVSAKRNK